MIPILLMLFGFLTFIVGIVFLFFDKLRRIGLVMVIIAILCFFSGLKSCSNSFSYYPSPEELQKQEEFEKKKKQKWTKTAIKTDKIKANILIQKEIDKIRKELVGDSIELYEKSTIELKSFIQPFEKKIVNDMNDNNKINYPFKGFDFENLSHIKFQKKWSNETKFIVPIAKQLIHVSGVLNHSKLFR